jgi:hypothetical protein
MLSKNHRFWSDRKRPGLEIKHLGTFSEARTGIGFLRILPRAARTGGRQDDAELLYCVEGVFSYDANARVKPLASENGAEFFVITLPMLADLAAMQRGTDAVRAGKRELSGAAFLGPTKARLAATFLTLPGFDPGIAGRGRYASSEDQYRAR